MLRSRYVRPRACLAAYGLSVGAVLAGSLAPGIPGSVLFHAGAGFAAFVTTTGAVVLAWEHTTDRVNDLGRRGGGALLLVGLAGGLLTLAAAHATRAALHGDPWASFALLAAAAALVGSAPLVALTQDATPARLLNTLGALGLAGAASAWVPYPLALFPQGLAFAALLLTWVGEGEVPGDPSPGPATRDR